MGGVKVLLAQEGRAVGASAHAKVPTCEDAGRQRPVPTLDDDGKRGGRVGQGDMYEHHKQGLYDDRVFLHYGNTTIHEYRRNCDERTCIGKKQPHQQIDGDGAATQGDQ